MTIKKLDIFRKSVVFLVLITTISLIGSSMSISANTELVETDNTNQAPVYVDDNLLSNKAIIQEGVTYVPVNTVFESLGYKVNYNPDTMQIVLIKGATNIKISLSENTIIGTLVEDGADISISNFIDNSLQDENGVILIPVRSVSENIGCEVVWNGDNVRIYSKQFNGEKKATNIKEVTVNNSYYITAITKALSKKDLNANITHFIFAEGTDDSIIELHQSITNLFNTLKTTDKKYETYKDIDLDYKSVNQAPLDQASKELLIVRRQLAKCKQRGLIDDTKYLKEYINSIYAMA